MAIFRSFGKINNIEFSKIELYKLSPRGRRDDMLPADGSSTRGGSTFVSGRVRGPHIFGGRPAAGSRHADSLGSCATQPACYSLGWTDGRTDGRIAVSLNPPLRRSGGNNGRHSSLSCNNSHRSASSLVAADAEDVDSGVRAA